MRVPGPRSSTHCELVALGLAMQIEAAQVLTDSLTSLRLLRSWAFYSVARVLRCADRVDIRRVLQLAAGCAVPPILEKVKAHNERAIKQGHPKAVGNDLADHQAKVAALGSDVPVAAWDPRRWRMPCCYTTRRVL